MATFVLTARSNIDRAGGFHFDKGDSVTMHINVVGITPYNLFNNSRCKEQLLQQFRINGIDLPATDPAVSSRGYWDILMMK